ncbi:MAG: GNAT family N-acetyltransferase [Methylotenera sp.]|nr:GNAT family N-acetyltransferase [Methylotenera sp.]
MNALNQHLHFRKAESTDAPAITMLINSAYRGESSRAGWTTEADILEGLRTSAKDVQLLIESENSMILICLDGNDLLGAICLEKALGAVHLGMFVVNPILQGKGLGKKLLNTAEKLAQQVWDAEKLQMHVITIRYELIAFYERRGYQRTGVLIDFPVNPSVWQPKREGLRLETLEKIIKC